MRLFIAINFPGEIKAAIAQIRDHVRKSALSGNFTLTENLHLTLVFLGECDVRQLEAVKSIMGETTFPQFTLKLDQVGCFKRDRGKTTWWIGLKENRALLDLQADLSGRLKQKGFILESRPYVPHVTIGREVKMRAGFVQPEVPQAGLNVTSIELMESERINGRLVYTQVYSSASQ
jgi:2'-5' RNA ligase